ncbi:hypothetical protein PV04_10929 [Phialophora macrospora]|uniref:DUF3669 domain-containing protein n=1 Tax=Phialophora macrospora TaxID=1851006 RepID=A0A0D2F4F8_9EURO|nr:hypothetical protein PV04_10929 [Phialophora macrospora]
MSSPPAAASGAPSPLPKLSDRRQQVSSYSARTPSFDVLAMQNLLLEEELVKEAANETHEQTLKRLLSTKSAISTTSSFAERQQASAGQQAVFREIGTGSIGTVLEHPGTIHVYKFSLLDQNNKIWNNYLMGLRIQKSFSRNSSIAGDIEIPQCMWFATAHSQFWTSYKQQIPASRNPGDVLCMERIFPLPKIIRNKIVDVFCQLDPPDREQAKNIASNKDCLVRPYLGRSRVAGSHSRLKAFSLQNYKLHLDQIQYLRLDAEEFATSMAKAMAIMHWDIRIDAADIEFVLGSSPTVEGTIPVPPEDPESLQMAVTKIDTFREITISNPNFKQRLVNLWLLDFDACRDISMDPSGVQQAVRAFLENEPYCPRPNGGTAYSDHLWRAFGAQYLATSASILATAKPDVAALPNSFLIEVAKALAEPRSQPSSSGQGRGRGHLSGEAVLPNWGEDMGEEDSVAEEDTSVKELSMGAGNFSHSHTLARLLVEGAAGGVEKCNWCN